MTVQIDPPSHQPFPLPRASVDAPVHAGAAAPETRARLRAPGRDRRAAPPRPGAVPGPRPSTDDTARPAGEDPPDPPARARRAPRASGRTPGGPASARGADAPADAAAPGPVPGARRALPALCVTVTVSQGALFYAFPVLAPAVSLGTGWSLIVLTALFSGSQVLAALAAPLVGRWLRLRGPRPVMTAAAVLGAAALAACALAPSLWVFAAAWQAAGLAAAGLFYPTAFAALTHWYRSARVRAVTTLTLVGGFAGTVFAPLAALLEAHLGWRAALLALAALVALVVAPLHLWALRAEWTPHGDPESGRRAVRGVMAGRAFWALTAALALGAFTVHAVVVDLVPFLREHGFGTAEAAWVLGATGIGQVLGRLVYAPWELRSRPGTRAVAVLLVCASGAVLTAVLALAGAAPAALFAAALAVGAGRGLLTLVQATAIADRWGPEHYTTLNSIMHTPIALAAALAPGVCALAAGAAGGYAPVFFALGAVALLGALVAPAGSPAAVAAGDRG
ncbi:MFS transporter [Nocardiopsis sp. MT53]|uniref:MFS transporter n=1 Tax=Nocardiopsis sp. MT53 TaxID=2865672 RepID=UPI00272E6FD7|nr:MFS transporter [Nocardiopsis sp. MT53]